MLAGFLILFIPSAFGVVLLSRLEFLGERVGSLAAGVVLGLAGFSATSYLLSPLVPGVRWATGPVWLVMAIWTGRELAAPGFRARWKALPWDRATAVVAAVASVCFVPMAGKLLFEGADGLRTAVLCAFGDVAWHTASIASFVEGQTFPPTNPIFAGHPLIYPFLVNWLSAAMVAWGSSLGVALDWPAAVLIPAALVILFGFARAITGRPLAAVVTVLLFVFAGSVGGVTRFPAEWHASGRGLFDFLLHLPGENFSGTGGSIDRFHFINPVLSLLLPQRSFLFGLPLAFLILWLWTRGRDRKTAVVAGLLAGSLPGFHLHTILALVPALAAMTPRERWKQAPWAVGTAALVGLPAVVFFVARGHLDNHLGVHWGWMGDRSDWFLYWLANAGLVFPAAAALLWPYRREPAAKLAGAGLVLFSVCNLFQFARWIWDNYKLIVYAWLFVIPLVGLACSHAIERWPKAWVKVVLAFLLLAQTATGLLDVGKLMLPTAPSWVVWDGAARSAAEILKRHTPPLSRVAAAPIHNSPIFLAGRMAYLGYAAHVWSHGGDPWGRERDLKAFLDGKLNRLPEPVDYVLIGPAEKRQFPNAGRLTPGPLVFSDGTHSLFRAAAP